MEEKTITNQEYYDSEKKILKSEKLLTKEYDGYEAIEEYREYFENGELKIKGEYVTGQKGNEWLYYKDDGTLIEKEHYIEGILLEKENYEINDKAKEYFNDQEEYKGFYKETYHYNKRVASEEINIDDKRSKKNVYSEEGELLYSEENKYEENKVIQNRYYASGKLEKEREAIIDGDNVTESIKEYYISGEVEKERKAVFNSEDKGTYTVDLEYDKSGNVTYKRILDNGKLNQKVFEYEADKLIRETGRTSYYKDGNHNIEEENEKEYYESGQLKSEINTSKTGESILNNYSELGKLLYSSEKKEDGVVKKEYYESGQLKSEINTSKTGESILNNYSELGKLLSTREEKESGVIEKEYYRSGILQQEKNFSRINENGEYHVYGSIKEYYDNGNLERELTTVDSLYDGQYKAYHRNGVLSYEESYEQGKKLKNLKIYNEKGKLNHDQEKFEKSFMNKLHSFIFKPKEEKQEDKEAFVWQYYSTGASPEDSVYKLMEIEKRHKSNDIQELNLSEKLEMGSEGIKQDGKSVSYYPPELEDDSFGNPQLLPGTIKEEIEWKNNEMITYRKYSKEGIILEDIDRNHSGEKVIENYDNGQLKSSKEYDENGKITDTWNFYDKSGNIEKMMLYTDGKLMEESKKEAAITEIGYVHYVYNGHEDVQRIEYAPKEDEYMKIYHLKDGTKDIYHEKEEVTLYEKHDEKGTIVERGQFDEESKQIGTWEYYDTSGKLTEKKEFQEGKEVLKESSNGKKNPWAKSKGKDKESENER